MLSTTAQFVSFLQSKHFRLLENVDLAYSCLLALICTAFLEFLCPDSVWLSLHLVLCCHLLDTGVPHKHVQNVSWDRIKKGVGLEFSSNSSTGWPCQWLNKALAELNRVLRYSSQWWMHLGVTGHSFINWLLTRRCAEQCPHNSLITIMMKVFFFFESVFWGIWSSELCMHK